MCVCMCIYVCMYACVYMCVCVCVYGCRGMYMCVYLCLCLTFLYLFHVYMSKRIKKIEVKNKRSLSCIRPGASEACVGPE